MLPWGPVHLLDLAVCVAPIGTLWRLSELSDFQKFMTYASQHHQGQLMANFPSAFKSPFYMTQFNTW